MIEYRGIELTWLCSHSGGVLHLDSPIFSDPRAKCDTSIHLDTQRTLDMEQDHPPIHKCKKCLKYGDLL